MCIIHSKIQKGIHTFTWCLLIAYRVHHTVLGAQNAEMETTVCSFLELRVWKRERQMKCQPQHPVRRGLRNVNREISFSSPSGLTPRTWMLDFFVLVPQFPEALLIFPPSVFSLCCLGWVISTVPSSGLLILFSVVSFLLLSPSIEFWNFSYYIFQF